MPARFLCVGTHHKTGTVWMRRTFHKFATDSGIPVIRAQDPANLRKLPRDGAALVVHWHANFPLQFYDHPDARFLHVIRDPRDVLISGARYHATAPTGNEKFLRTPRNDLGGATYQEHLNALPDWSAQLLFEMENMHRATLTEMLAWPYGHPSAVDLRFEDLVGDTDCSRFRGALDRMDVDGFGTEAVTEYYWRHALFGGAAKPEDRAHNVAKHVKSGKPAQWKSKLPREVAEIYADRYGASLIALGYARDTDWVTECPQAAELSEAS